MTTILCQKFNFRPLAEEVSQYTFLMFSPVFIIVVEGVGLHLHRLLIVTVILLSDDLLHLGHEHLAPDDPLLPLEHLSLIRLGQRLILQTLEMSSVGIKK